MTHFELVTRESDIRSEKIMQALLERGLPFVEVRLGAADAAVLEETTRKDLPMVFKKERMIGGYSDLINHLRRPRRWTSQAALAW